MLQMVGMLAHVLSNSSTRQWHRTEQIRSPLHPAVRDMLASHTPRDWHWLVLEWPHVSRSDALRLAYTRSNEHGEIDRRTITTVGKYLTRHFPDAPSDLIRDLAARYGAGGYSITRTMSEMQQAVHTGPESCMTKFSVGPEHPYSVYDPELGWGMALRKDGLGNVTGRALVWEDPEGDKAKRFVRTYSKHTNSDGYSQADDGLKNWLVEQGYERTSSWEGTLLRYIKHHRYTDRLLMPYIDGSCQRLVHESYDDTMYFDSDGDGEYEANSTDGTASVVQDDTVCCDNCGDDVHQDDIHSAGYSDDEAVCNHCIDNSYVSAIGRRGREYYVHHDNVVWVESQDQHYCENYLDDNGVIQLYDGEWDHRDNAVWLNSREVWLHQDDNDAVYCEHSSEYEHSDDVVCLADGNYALENDAWMCEHSNEWYLIDSNDVTAVQTACGKTIHPDYADEYAQIGSV
tara:strand:+ start:2796 stop:4166 length:1371 start_codon:yes stop_codon:yes gene_type:complete